jgi:hypothetical protein
MSTATKAARTSLRIVFINASVQTENCLGVLRSVNEHCRYCAIGTTVNACGGPSGVTVSPTIFASVAR